MGPQTIVLPVHYINGGRKRKAKQNQRQGGKIGMPEREEKEQTEHQRGIKKRD
jgi:hypothetical protein